MDSEFFVEPTGSIFFFGLVVISATWFLFGEHGGILPSRCLFIIINYDDSFTINFELKFDEESWKRQLAIFCRRLWPSTNKRTSNTAICERRIKMLPLKRREVFYVYFLWVL